MYPLAWKFPPLTFLVLLPIWGPEDRMQAEPSGAVSSQPYNQNRAGTRDRNHWAGIRVRRGDELGNCRV